MVESGPAWLALNWLGYNPKKVTKTVVISG